VSLAAELRERGFVRLPGILDPDTVEASVLELERLSGRSREDFASLRHRPAGLLRSASKAWTLPDGVSKRKAFWPIVTDERLVGALREVLSPELRFLQHTDLHVGFSAVTWHRDSVDRRLGNGPDWLENDESYRLVRVGFYLQGAASSRFALGLVPGSHREGGDPGERARQERSASGPAQALRLLTGRDPLAAAAEWVATEPGDALVFDPRVLHAGSPVAGPKYSLFLAYGVPGRHFVRHQAYYRYLRSELGYADLDPELVERLCGASLYAGEVPEPPAAASAWKPSWLRTLAAKRIRPAIAPATSPKARKASAP